MGNAIEEKELADHEGLDKHNDASSRYTAERDDVEDAQDVKHDVARPGQVSFEERHLMRSPLKKLKQR